MRITTKGRYALRAVLTLAAAKHDRPISIRQIAEAEDLSPEFLEQIFFKLKKTGMIVSTRGPGGGFQLNRDPEEITLLEILEGAGEVTDLTPCSNEEIGEKGCDRTPDCLAHKVWKNSAAQVKNVFAGITLGSIIAGNGNIKELIPG